ncbi:MAG: 30S ribosomal protein S20 [Chloroflexi bacterium]|nr:30S ribosomal protein S20 [Chloroflexota bacterium]
MPSEKSLRGAVRKAQQNRGPRGAARTAVAGARRALAESNPEAARPAVQKAVSALDRAVRAGAIHKNNASRRKSRLARQLNSGKS